MISTTSENESKEQKPTTALNRNVPQPGATPRQAGQRPAPDLEKAALLWGRPFGSPEDLFTLSIPVLDYKASCSLHLLGLKADELIFLGYDDARGTRQPDLEQVLKEGEVAIAVKHHAPRPHQDLKEALKFQCTHVQLVVRSKSGVFSINNPAGYCGGLFGEADYPSTFLMPVFPSSNVHGDEAGYMGNTLNWAALLNAVTNFPGDYNGGDPLSCRTHEELMMFGNAVISAVLGDSASLEWLSKPQQQLYCAELAYTALNLGVHFPLTPTYVGVEYEALKDALESKTFLLGHQNPYIAEIGLTIPHVELRAVKVNEETQGETGEFWKGLAIRPLDAAEMVVEYVARSVPREELGEITGARLQAAVLEEVLPEIKSSISVDNGYASEQLNELLSEVTRVVSTPHGSYAEFRSALNPSLEALAVLSFQANLSYVPPHCFLLRAADYLRSARKSGLIGWRYLGHGLHDSILVAQPSALTQN